MSMRAPQLLSLLALLSPLVEKTAAQGDQQELGVDANKTPDESDVLTEQEAKAAGSTNSAAVSDVDTVFNGINVPPMVELTGTKFDDEIRHGYWFVKHYSPYCPHCLDIAPTWQTLYEFYYTMAPVPGQKGATESESMNSFTRYYDFHFASIDCTHWADTCKRLNVEAFPTFSIYKDGSFVKKFEGRKDMERLSKFLEQQLDTIRPGSRPVDGIVPPQPNTTSSPDFTPLDLRSTTDTDPVVSKALPSMTVPVASFSEPSDAVSPTAEASFIVPPVTKGSPRTSRASRPANAHGTSVVLDQESFQKMVTNTQDPWYVKFYAPWCHHCQALAPSWLQMAKELQGKLNVGEVNCDANARLCKDVRVKAYPTIHFFRGGERVEYEGLRGLGDLVSYAKKALDVGDGVQDIDAAGLKQMEQNEEVIFVYFYDHATASEDFDALDRLTLSLVGHAKLVKTNDPALYDRFKISTWPSLLVTRDGRASKYEGLAPSEMRDHRRVLTWMQRVWLPIVPELTVANAEDIMKGKFAVLGILSRERSGEFAQSRKELKNAALEWMEKQTRAFELERTELRDAKQLRLEEAEDRDDDRAKRAAKSIHIDIREDDQKQVRFAWVDGVFWERWIKTTYGLSVKDGERVIIADGDVSSSCHLDHMLIAEPPVLGHHGIRRVDHAEPDVDLGDNPQGRG